MAWSDLPFHFCSPRWAVTVRVEERHKENERRPAFFLRRCRKLRSGQKRVNEADVIATCVGVDSLMNALGTWDNGIVYGPRGTGKTHALHYLAKRKRAKGNRVLYIDMEQDVGATEDVMPIHLSLG
jgi:Cdc6-like AAA superfamily ATPase